MPTKRWEMREYVARKLGRFHDGLTATVDACDTTLYDVPGISDLSGDAERLEDSYLIARDETADPEWRRVTATDFTNEQVSINRAFDSPLSSQAVGIIELLTPDEWNEAIDEAFAELWYQDREEISLTTHLDTNGNTVTTTEYDLPEWLSTRGQLRNLRYRNTATGREQQVARYRPSEVDGHVRVHIFDAPASVATYVLVVEGFRYYDAFYDDLQEVNTPQVLWQSAVEVAAVLKIFKKFGERFKRQFAQNLAIAEKKLLENKAKILPTVITQDYAPDDDWAGPDIDSFFGTQGWWD